MRAHPSGEARRAKTEARRPGLHRAAGSGARWIPGARFRARRNDGGEAWAWRPRAARHDSETPGQSLVAKIYRFSEFRICGICPPSRPCQRGASRSSRDAGRGAVDAAAPARKCGDRDGQAVELRATRLRHGDCHSGQVDRRWCAHRAPARRPGRPRTEKSCGPDGRSLPSSLAVMRRPDRAPHPKKPRGDGGNSASLPEESTKDTVKTIRAGKAGRPATPVIHPVCISVHTDCGCRRRPAFPAPSGN
jgi:hypothetical protein